MSVQAPVVRVDTGGLSGLKNQPPSLKAIIFSRVTIIFLVLFAPKTMVIDMNI